MTQSGMNWIELRSDTMTLPTEAMMQSIAKAELGDDVFREDPTTRKLEELVADFLGKEAAMLAPSGTMTNQIAIQAHTRPGDEALIDWNAHVYFYEGGAAAALAGVTFRHIHSDVRGIFTTDQLRQALRPASEHFPRTRLICFENTHNRGGGSIWKPEEIQAALECVRPLGLRSHMDGARLWNASVATGIPEAEFVKDIDSVSVCFSKGLGAPIGSALVGAKDFIEEARRIRKRMGGGMRQAGIVAAGALHALQNHRERLAEDHQNASQLAKALCGMPGIAIDPTQVETNIVRIPLTQPNANDWIRLLKENGVGVVPLGPDALRAVANMRVDAAGIQKAIQAFEICSNALSS